MRRGRPIGESLTVLPLPSAALDGHASGALRVSIRVPAGTLRETILLAFAPFRDYGQTGNRGALSIIYPPILTERIVLLGAFKSASGRRAFLPLTPRQR